MPDWKAALREQLAHLHLEPARESEIVEELAAHAQDRFAELISAGATEADAFRTTLDDLNAGERLARELRGVERTEARGGFLGSLRQDLRYAFRTLRGNRAFTAVAMLTLALGIGANTAIFSVVHGVLLRPLAYPDPDRLLLIYERTPDFTQNSVAYLNYLDWRSSSRSFADMGAYRFDDFNFTGAGEPEHLAGEYVSASFFPTLGVTPLMGRRFLAEEDRPEAGCTVMLGYGFWKSRLAADPKILGKTLTLNAASCTVVGVLPRDFHLRDGVQIYVPIEQWKSVELHSREAHPGIRVVGRLRRGTSTAAAQAEMSSICAVLARQYPKSNAGHGATLTGMKEDLVGGIRTTLWLLAGAVGFVLIIACANVANLLLARSTARRREFAIRAALGASRGRIVRQLLTESVLLSIAGAALGLLVAQWGTRLVLTGAPGTLPRSSEIDLDWTVLFFTLAVSIVTGILFGLSPAWLGANADPQESLKEGTRGAGGGRHRAEGIFVAVEVGLAVILLAGAGLMIESVWRLLRIAPGFNTRNVLTMQVALSPGVMSDGPAIRRSYQQLLTRVGSIPGAQSAAMTSLLPLGDSDSENSFWLGTGPQPAQDQMRMALFFVVTTDYFKLMQIPLRHGRFFTEQDTLSSANAVIVDEVFARQVFPGQDPIGKMISLVELGSARIVGVAGHVKHWGLDGDDTAKIRAEVYMPFLQVPDQFMAGGAAGLTLLVRTTPEPLSLLSAVRRQVAGPTEDQPVYSVATMEQTVSESLAERRFTMLLLIIFAATALLLAAVGIYGVMSYAVTRRAHELGIRLALGATRREIVGIVIKQGMRLAAIGMAAGLAAAIALTRLLAGLLYGVHPGDPVTFTATALLLGAIALAACYIPARRATTVDPVVALRCE